MFLNSCMKSFLHKNILLVLPKLYSAEETAHDSCVKGSFVTLLGKVLIFNLHLLALFNLGENAMWSSSPKNSSLSLFSNNAALVKSIYYYLHMSHLKEGWKIINRLFIFQIVQKWGAKTEIGSFAFLYFFLNLGWCPPLLYTVGNFPVVVTSFCQGSHLGSPNHRPSQTQEFTQC